MKQQRKKIKEPKSVFIIPSKHTWWVLQLTGKKQAENNSNNIEFHTTLKSN
jgi:hypothetical protein